MSDAREEKMQPEELDTDLMTLESYLDDELLPAASAALEVRLKADRVLAADLAELREQRRNRLAVFRSFEPDTLAAERISANVRKAMLRDLVWVDRGRRARRWSIAAAGVAVAFLAGWAGHRQFNSEPIAFLRESSIVSRPTSGEPSVGVTIIKDEIAASQKASINREIDFNISPDAFDPTIKLSPDQRLQPNLITVAGDKWPQYGLQPSWGRP